jgi:hypothetical protein
MRAPKAILPKQGHGDMENAARSHISTPPAATTDKPQTRRYTNNLLGTEYRSAHPRRSYLGDFGAKETLIKLSVFHRGSG